MPILLLTAALLPGCGSSDQPVRGAKGPVGQLDGLWEARRRFGPDVRGDLTIERRSDSWHAEIAGHAAPVRVIGRRVVFELADQAGSFEGVLDPTGGHIVGHWTQPSGVSTGGFRYASPATLEKRDAEHWRGVIRPLDDHVTWRLSVQSGPAGQSRAFLRNPERNLGIFTGVSRVEQRGLAVLLIGGRQGGTGDEILARGTYDGDSETIAVPLPGGTYDFRRVDGEIDNGFYPRGLKPVRYRYAPPPALGDGWPVASLDEVGIDPAGIERFVQFLIDMPMDSVNASEVHALLVARHGKLVLEEYFHGFHRDEPHDLRSAAKSLTSILVGAAIQAGSPLAVSTPVYQIANRGTFPPGLEPRKRALTVEHLLTMSSGLDCDDGDPDSLGNENRMQEQTQEPDWYRYTLALAMVRDPGRRAVYCAVQPNLLGAVLRGATGESLPLLFDRLVAQPLGIRRYHLPISPTGEAYMGGGVYLLPRDTMKLGQLMLDGGEWKGKRIIGREWVQRSTSPLFELAGIHYGYLWWIIEFPHRSRTVRAFFAAGNGGQAVIGVPELDLLVGFHGGNYSDRPRTYLPQRVWVPKYVLPAVSDGG